MCMGCKIDDIRHLVDVMFKENYTKEEVLEALDIALINLESLIKFVKNKTESGRS